MKRIFSVIFVFLAFYCQSSAQFVERSKNDGLVGPVRSLRIVNFDCSSSPGICPENPYRTQVVLYDRKANEIERTLYEADGSIEHQVNSSYNAEGLQTGWKEYYGKGVANAEGLNKHAVYTYRSGRLAEVIVYQEKSIAHKSTYVYDARGNKILESNSGPDAITTSRNYKYDSANNLVEESSSGQSYSTKVERIYDGFGNAIKESYFDNGSLRSVSTKTYENGKLIKAVVLKPDGSLLSTTRNVYDGDGKLTETNINGETLIIKTTIEYDQTGSIKSKEVITTYKDNEADQRGVRVYRSHDPTPGRVFTTYNKKGFQTEELQYSESGLLTRKHTSIYDEAGKLIETTFYKANGDVESKRVYEYDGHGNLVKTSAPSISTTGELRYLILEQRIITYY